MGSFLVKAINFVKTAKYGKQIGQVSKSGLVCYGKAEKGGGKVYTTLNAKTGEVVRTKRFANIGKNYHDTYTYDAKGDLIGSTNFYKQKIGYGMSSDNSKAFRTRVISTKYNRFGQTIERRDVSLKPDITEPKAFIHSRINNEEYGTYLNTLTGEKRTYQCMG